MSPSSFPERVWSGAGLQALVARFLERLLHHAIDLARVIAAEPVGIVILVQEVPFETGIGEFIVHQVNVGLMML